MMWLGEGAILGFAMGEGGGGLEGRAAGEEEGWRGGGLWPVLGLKRISSGSGYAKNGCRLRRVHRCPMTGDC